MYAVTAAPVSTDRKGHAVINQGSARTVAQVETLAEAREITARENRPGNGQYWGIVWQAEGITDTPAPPAEEPEPAKRATLKRVK